MKISPIKIAYNYSHADETYRNELEKHLTVLQRNGLIESWHDRKILAGQPFSKEIDAKFESADIILLLVSSDFIASEYCYSIEAAHAA